MTNTTIETVNEFVIDLKSSNDEIKKVMGMLYYNSLKNNLNLNSIDEILFEFLNSLERNLIDTEKYFKIHTVFFSLMNVIKNIGE